MHEPFPAHVKSKSKVTIHTHQSPVILSDNSEEPDIDVDEASDVGEFDIKYEIIVNNARIDFSLDNVTSFNIFQQNVAIQMGVPQQTLSTLGYTMTFWPKNLKPVPKLVDTDARYEDMLREVEEYMKPVYTTGKKRTLKQKKPFSIVLIDTGSDSKKDGKGQKVTECSPLGQVYSHPYIFT